MTVLKCQKCKGFGYLEFEHGLIQVRCETCKGRGEVEIDSENGDVETTGRDDYPLGVKTPRKYRKSRKSKASKVA